MSILDSPSTLKQEFFKETQQESNKENDPDLDLITLNQGSIEVIVGLLDHERIQPQRLWYFLQVGIKKEEIWTAGLTKDLSQSVNYGDLDLWMRWLLQKGRFFLLESALVVLHRALFRLNALCSDLQEVDLYPCKQALFHSLLITLHKPEILPHSTPGLHLQRTRQWMEIHDQPIRVKASDLLPHHIRTRIHHHLSSSSKEISQSQKRVLNRFLDLLNQSQNQSHLQYEALIHLDECLIFLLNGLCSKTKLFIPTHVDLIEFCPCVGQWTYTDEGWESSRGIGLVCLY